MDVSTSRTRHARRIERLADHLAARGLLDTHLSEEDLAASFGPGTPLREACTGEDAYVRAGVLEALAIQLPERVSAELPDLVGRSGRSFHVWNAFVSSIGWRRPDAFAERTMALLREYDRSQGTDLALRTRLAVSTEPGNPFNARNLDRRLRQSTLPERDAIWTVGVARLMASGAADCPARVLVEWSKEAADGPIDHDRAKLAATTLSWLLSASHRGLRDRATKALSALLAPRLPLATWLVGSFSTVDDPYVVERVLCAAYGAGMLAPQLDGLEDLAREALALLEPSRCPVHLLTRDYARGIVALARYRGCLPSSVGFDVAAPPYSSPWPLEAVSDDEMGSFVETIETGTFRDAIAASTGDFGDFDRYIIQSRTRSFAAGSNGPSGAPQTASELLASWTTEFEATAGALQAAALDLLLDASRQARARGDEGREAAVAASKAFEATLGTFEWHDYVNRARRAVLGSSYPGYRVGREIVPFSPAWASRWVCWRAHDLGWRSELFREFERNDIGYAERRDHKVERIGKKYQWIALHELLARLSDHVALRKESWDKFPFLQWSLAGGREGH